MLVAVGVLVGAPVGVRVGVRVTVGVLVGVPVGGTAAVSVMVGVKVRVGAVRATEPDTVQRPSNVSDTEKNPSRPSSEGTRLKSARHTTRVPPPLKGTDPLGLADVGGVPSFPG